MAERRHSVSEPGTYVVLCVDDHVPGLVTRKAFLEAFGYTVQTVTNGLAALSLIERMTPDVVLLDYRMPGMDGLEVMERMHAKHPDLPVIVLTGYPREVPKRLEELAFACIAKGTTPTKLLEMLGQALGGVPSRPGVLPQDRLPKSASEDVWQHLHASKQHVKKSKEKAEAVQQRLDRQAVRKKR